MYIIGQGLRMPYLHEESFQVFAGYYLIKERGMLPLLVWAKVKGTGLHADPGQGREWSPLLLFSKPDFHGWT